MKRHYTLRQLQSFMEVARHESMSRAAEALHVTQPAISMQIKQLEECFDVALFQASGRNVVLTDAGRDFARHCAQVMVALNNLDDAVAAHRGAERGRVEIAVVTTAKYFMPYLLVEFGKVHPDVDIRLHIDNKEQVFAMLERAEVDLVVSGRIPSSLKAEGFAFASNPQGFVAHPGHPLVGRQHLSVRELAGYDFVMREPGSGTRAAMEKLFDAHDCGPRIRMQMPSNETIKQAVMAGMALGFLSLRTVRHEVSAGLIAPLSVTGTPVPGHWQVAWLENKVFSPAGAAFCQFLRERAGPLVDAWA